MIGFIIGLAIGCGIWIVLRYGVLSIYTVQPNERAVVTSFGRAQRIPGRTTLDDPMAEFLDEEARTRYAYPQLRVVGPGGPYFKLPWQKVYKVDVAIQTVNLAHDPESRSANHDGTVLEAVTKDQLNIGITGQLRFKVCEQNLYAYIFGVRHPIAHVMGYFISILRERIANFEAPKAAAAPGLPGAAGSAAAAATAAAAANPAAAVVPGEGGALAIEGISINDLRKNLQDLNAQMDTECRTSAARYGMILDASLITGFDPPTDIEAALAAINTAHNEVSAEISRAQAGADQTIEQSKRAVEIETMKAEAETQPLVQLTEQLGKLKQDGTAVLQAYVRNVRLELPGRAERIVLPEVRS